MWMLGLPRNLNALWTWQRFSWNAEKNARRKDTPPPIQWRECLLQHSSFPWWFMAVDYLFLLWHSQSNNISHHHTTKIKNYTPQNPQLKQQQLQSWSLQNFSPFIILLSKNGKTKTCKTSIEIPFVIRCTTRNVGIWQSNRYCFIAVFLSAKELEAWIEKSNCGLMNTCVWSRHIHPTVAVHIPSLCNYETPKQQRDT